MIRYAAAYKTVNQLGKERDKESTNLYGSGLFPPGAGTLSAYQQSATHEIASYAIGSIGFLGLWTGLELFAPSVLAAYGVKPQSKIGRFVTRFSVGHWVNRALTLPVKTTLGSLAPLERAFMPFMEERMYRHQPLLRAFDVLANISKSTSPAEQLKAQAAIFEYLHKTNVFDDAALRSILIEALGGESFDPRQSFFASEEQLGRLAKARPHLLYQDLFKLGIVKYPDGFVPGRDILTASTEVTTTLAARLASFAMHVPILRTFSLYPALISMSIKPQEQIRLSLFARRGILDGHTYEVTEHMRMYMKMFPNLQQHAKVKMRYYSEAAEQMAVKEIDLATKEGADEFNRLVLQWYERKVAPIREQVTELFSKARGVTDAAMKEEISDQINQLRRTIPDFYEALQELVVNKHEVPLELVYDRGSVYASMMDRQTLKKVADEALIFPRAHGVKGTSLHLNRFTRVIEEVFGDIDDDAAKRIDERWIVLGRSKGGVYSRSLGIGLRDAYTRLVRLLDSPVDILQYFGFDKTQAEQEIEFTQTLRHQLDKYLANKQEMKDMVIEAKKPLLERVYDTFVRNRLGAGGDYSGSFAKLLWRSIMPGWVEATEKRQRIYYLGTANEIRRENYGETIEAFKKDIVKFHVGEDIPEEVRRLYEPFYRRGSIIVEEAGIHRYIRSATYDVVKRRFSPGLLGISIGFMALEGSIPYISRPVKEVLRARAWLGDVTFAHDYIASVEAAVPGSTSPLNVLGFIGGGFMAGYMGSVAYSSVKKATLTGGELIGYMEELAIKSEVSNDIIRNFLSTFRLSRRLGHHGRIGLIGAAFGLAADLPFLPAQALSLLFGDKTEEEVIAENEGKRDIPVMHGRWWEMGLSNFRGEKLGYYRPSTLYITPGEAMRKQLWGDDINWFGVKHALTTMFTYELEKKHYYDRPYFTTIPAFSDFFGPLSPIINATLGELIKPTKYMHMEAIQAFHGDRTSIDPSATIYEYSADTSVEPVNRYTTSPDQLHKYAAIGANRPVAGNIPGLRPGFYLANDPRLTMREMAYRAGEAAGLVGFSASSYAKSSIYNRGYSFPFDDLKFAESAGRMVEGRRLFWDYELGGLLGASEFIRRVYPNRRFMEQWTNPIQNTMPKWMPGSREMINFRQGDPYAQIKAGELRLPGAGYALRNPNVRGVKPEDYDAITRLKILGDVAPYSKSYTRTEARILKQVPEGVYTPQQLQEIKDAIEMRRMRIKRYMYGHDQPVDTMMGRIYGVAKEFALGLPSERLTPIAPAHKFLSRRTAIQKYRAWLIYGGDMQEWTTPAESFVEKAIQSFREFWVPTSRVEVSDEVKEIRDVNLMFNALTYIKGRKLEGREGKRLGWFGKKTIPGINPYSATLFDIQRSLPYNERRFVFEFTEERSYKAQRVIYDMLPEELRRIYKAIWARQLLDDIRNKRIGDDTLTTRLIANRAASIIGELGENEFKYVTSMPDREYRMKMAEEQIERHGGRLPGDDWLGWRNEIDLKDIQLQYVNEEGMDMHKVGLWEPRLYAMEGKDVLADLTQDLRVPFSMPDIGGLFSSASSSFDHDNPGADNLIVNRTKTDEEILLQQAMNQGY